LNPASRRALVIGTGAAVGRRLDEGEHAVILRRAAGRDRRPNDRREQRLARRSRQPQSTAGPAQPTL